MFDSIDFVNEVQKTLQDHITANMNVYVGFDYNDVRNALIEYPEKYPTFQKKPVVHLSEISVRPQGKTLVTNTGEKGEKVRFAYNVYVVIDDSIQESKSRKEVINYFKSYLKYTFDNEPIVDFKKFEIIYSKGNIEKNADNLHAGFQEMSFEIIKTLA